MTVNKNFYLQPNDNLQGYDILKRGSVVTDEGMKDEKILTVYSAEYIDAILDTLNEVDKSEG